MNILHYLLAIILGLAPSSTKTPEPYLIPTGFGVNFWDAMWCVKDKIPTLQKSITWHNLEKAYNQHIVNNLEIKENRIPKIIHQIWIGSPYPKKHKPFQKTWLDNHPDWTYILWTDKEIEQFGLVNKDAYDATNNCGAKSDIARYEILYRLGGLYVDTDFECLRPFDIFHACCDFYTGSAHFVTSTAFMAIIGCVPGHPILLSCIESLNIQKIAHARSAMDVLQSTGPAYFSKAVNAHLAISTDTSVVFPSGYFYPWPHYNRDQNSLEQIQKWIRPETFAIHHWHSSWNNAALTIGNLVN